MAPIAAGFMVMVGAAVVMGLLVGAIGGALAWRVGWNLLLGGLLTTIAFVLVLIAGHPGDQTWLRAELAWGAAPMGMSFLIATIAARGLAARTRLRPLWTSLAAFGLTVAVAFLYLLLSRFLFQSSLWAPILAAMWADVLLVCALLGSRWLARR